MRRGDIIRAHKWPGTYRRRFRVVEVHPGEDGEGPWVEVEDVESGLPRYIGASHCEVIVKAVEE